MRAARTMHMLALFLAAWAATPPARAQSPQDDAHDAHDAHTAASGPEQGAAGATAGLGGVVAVSPHVALTAPRGPRRGDAARAAAVADTLRSALARFRDVRVAERAGCRIFAPGVRQDVYHFTHYGKAVREHFRFEPADPSSLLYRKRADGGFELVGAMFTAPQGATLAELDARVPLSVAQWHLHTNICVPREIRSRERWGATRGGRPLFGAAGVIAARAECEAAGGRFHARLFGWMVHANVLDGESAAVWGGSHAGHGSSGMVGGR